MVECPGCTKPFQYPCHLKRHLARKRDCKSDVARDLPDVTRDLLDVARDLSVKKT